MTWSSGVSAAGELVGSQVGSLPALVTTPTGAGAADVTAGRTPEILGSERHERQQQRGTSGSSSEERAAAAARNERQQQRGTSGSSSEERAAGTGKRATAAAGDTGGRAAGDTSGSETVTGQNGPAPAAAP